MCKNWKLKLKYSVVSCHTHNYWWLVHNFEEASIIFVKLMQKKTIPNSIMLSLFLWVTEAQAEYLLARQSNERHYRWLFCTENQNILWLAFTFIKIVSSLCGYNFFQNWCTVSHEKENTAIHQNVRWLQMFFVLGGNSFNPLLGKAAFSWGWLPSTKLQDW